MNLSHRRMPGRTGADPRANTDRETASARARSPGSSVAPVAAGQEDVQGARAVHALDPDQLDVAGGGGAGDEGVRAGRVEPGERLGQVRGDLIFAHDDQVEVGYQGERAAALTRSAGAVVQDDRAGLGDRD